MSEEIGGEIVPDSTRDLDIDGEVDLMIEDLDLWYANKQALYGVSLPIAKNSVTALIGPSGCGKSTLLRTINRMNDLIPICHYEGKISKGEVEITAKDADLVEIRRNIGMVFQRPNPFPKSIYDNVAYGVRLHHQPTREELDNIVEKSLSRAAIWSEVADRLHDLGTSLSGGQQQRLCIARTIAIEPDVILMDEPCSALDPIATAAIEELILELKKDFTVVIVTHSMSQAARVSDYTGFMYLGRMVEFNKTEKIFSDPDQELTKDTSQEDLDEGGIMPIRTGLDERISSVQKELKDYFEEARHVYADAIDAFTKLDSEVYKEAKEVRAKAREINWDLTNDLLLILALNQPLMNDLRIIATYLRAVDTVERLIRHARDIARSDRSIDENADELPDEIVEPVLEMHSSLNKLIDITVVCLTEAEEVPADEVRTHWRDVKASHAKAVAALSSLKSDTMGGKSARLEVINIVNRVDRSAYNIVRLNGMWHHALNNENIILD